MLRHIAGVLSVSFSAAIALVRQLLRQPAPACLFARASLHHVLCSVLLLPFPNAFAGLQAAPGGDAARSAGALWLCPRTQRPPALKQLSQGVPESTTGGCVCVCHSSFWCAACEQRRCTEVVQSEGTSKPPDTCQHCHCCHCCSCRCFYPRCPHLFCC